MTPVPEIPSRIDLALCLSLLSLIYLIESNPLRLISRTVTVLVIAIFSTPIIARARGAHSTSTSSARGLQSITRSGKNVLGGALNSATKLAATVDNDGRPFNRKLYNSRTCGTNGERIENAFKDHPVLCAPCRCSIILKGPE